MVCMGFDWRNKETRSKARFKFQIARRVLAWVLDRVEEAKVSVKKLPSLQWLLGLTLHLTVGFCIYGQQLFGQNSFWSFKKEVPLPQFIACVWISLIVNLQSSICAAPYGSHRTVLFTVSFDLHIDPQISAGQVSSLCSEEEAKAQKD